MSFSIHTTIYKHDLLSSEKFKSMFFPQVGEHGEFYGEPGDRTYILLAYLSTLFDHKNIIVWDAFSGLSSVALCYNTTNSVHGFTRHDYILPTLKQQPPSNVSFSNVDLSNPDHIEAWKSLILSSGLIFMDRSPHDGNTEYAFLQFLEKNHYEGIVVIDHIWSMKSMRDNCWLKLNPRTKCDVSLLGNHSGTGICWFSPNIEINNSVVYTDKLLKQWTLVTAYFDLTKCPDASAEIKARNSDYYFEHAVATLSLPYHMVIYCDEESYHKIKQIRSHPNFKTKYEIRNFEHFKINDKEFSEYRKQIIQNRYTHPYQFDPRNTASYYLFCMSRYIMLQETCLSNPFDSSHFCWINFCMERMGYHNLMHLEETLSVHRDKFSTCYIDYVPETLVNRVSEYYQMGRCSMCSGFFTGNKHYMYNVCGAILNKFVYYVNLGYGHADEQLYSPVYFDHPDWFEQYYGDYTEMITNYKWIYQRPTEPLFNFIRNSYNHGNYKMCSIACEKLLQSIAKNKCKLNEDHSASLQYYFTNAYLKMHSS